MTASGGRYGVGVDPGASSAVALVFASDKLSEVGNGQPWFVGGWNVYGVGGVRWVRLRSAVQAAHRMMSSAPCQIRIEAPAGGGASGRRNGWQFSVGRDCGRWEAMLWRDRPHGGIGLEVVAGNVWPKAVGVRYGKKGAGWHRVQEVAERVANSEAWLRAIGPKAISKAGVERQVCLAEATLIAIYAVTN